MPTTITFTVDLPTDQLQRIIPCLLDGLKAVNRAQNGADAEFIDAIANGLLSAEEDVEPVEAPPTKIEDLALRGEAVAEASKEMFEHNMKCRKSGCWQCAGTLMRLRDLTRNFLAFANKREKAPAKPR